MKGGAGDGNYFVSEAGDAVIEFVDEDFDHVFSSVDFTLPDNVENLVVNGDAIGIEIVELVSSSDNKIVFSASDVWTGSRKSLTGRCSVSQEMTGQDVPSSGAS